MLRLVAITVLLLAGTLRADPQDAIMRLKSHGASGTVIYSDAQRSLILSCAHMFWGHGSGNGRISQTMVAKPIVMDGVPGDAPPARMGRTRVLDVDNRNDLSLIEVDVTLPHVAPVAQAPNRNRRLLSIGYDEMKWPAMKRPATAIREEGTRTLTREKPFHGRSGGALLDADTGELVGVVSGYQSGGPIRRSLWEPTAMLQHGGWREVDGYPGIYVSHETILRFLARQQPRMEKQNALPQRP